MAKPRRITYVGPHARVRTHATGVVAKGDTVEVDPDVAAALTAGGDFEEATRSTKNDDAADRGEKQES